MLSTAGAVRLDPRSCGADSLKGLPSRLLADDAGRLGADAALRWFADPPRAEFVLPPSDALAVIVVTRGTYLLETGQRHKRAHAVMRPGSSAVTAPGREVVAGWASTSADGFRSIQLHVSDAVLQQTATAMGLPNVAQPDYLRSGDQRVVALMLELARDVRGDVPRLQLDHHVQALLQHLLGKDPAAEPPARALCPAALRAVTDCMRDHLAGPLTLDQIAAAAHLSPHHFIRRFTASTGESPIRFFTRMRMEHAQALLADGTSPVALIGTSCGYATTSAFSAAFRRTTGQTPTQFRASARK